MTQAGLPGPAPQPLGALPWPAGMLLLPDVPGADAVAAALVVGDEPSAWPPGTEFLRVALGDDPAAAVALVPGDDLVASYNRAVLVGGPPEWAGLGDPAGALGALVALGRFSLALDDVPPDPTGLSGELAAVVGSGRASAQLEQDDVEGALDTLAAAAAHASEAGSPVLAASLHASRVELLRTRVTDPARAVTAATDGLACLDGLTGAGPGELRADLQLSRALARQELAGADRSALLPVVDDLNAALRTFTEESNPELFAIAQEHLALAYLTMPMSTQGDRLRVGVAVSSLRAALRVFTPQTHPTAWASAQLNLANALQYLPSAHQADNLDEAVQLYEELLAHRDPRTDPLGTARVLANQGNALGHLGVFSDARERLAAAAELFTAAGDTDGAAEVAGVMAELERASAAAQATR